MPDRRGLAPGRLAARLTAVALLAAAAACAHFTEVGAVPPGLRARLAQHPMWLTTTLLTHEPGAFPPAEVLVIKKWETTQVHGRAARLKELYSSSLAGLFQRLHDGASVHATVDLRRDFAPGPFLPTPEQGLEAVRPFGRDTYEFRDLDGRRFELLVNGGRLRIVFAPAPNDYAVPRRLDGMGDVGIWRAPFGAETELLAQLTRAAAAAAGAAAPAQAPPLPPALDPEAGVFLHHDLNVSRQVSVVVDPDFPPALAPAVWRAAELWNAALDHPLFRVERSARPVDPADCVSGFKLCVRWLGAPDLAFTGANGYTNLAFDPQTGLITGGVVSLINDDVQLPLTPMAPADRARVLDGTLDWDWVAGAVLRFAEMNGVAHPRPEAYVEYLLLHEFGHFNGFGHNFYASSATTLAHPVTSVMTYPPFPVGHLANYLGESDLARLAVVYGKGARTAPPYCSTFDAMVPRQGPDGLYRKPPNCDLFTVGNQADWYIRLARQGPAGPFTGYPDLSHLSEELRAVYRDVAARKRLPPFNVLTRLGFLLADSESAGVGERARVTGYLCSLHSERKAIAAQLLEFHKLTLRCPEPGYEWLGAAAGRP